MGGISVAVLETVMAFLSFCLVLYALRARRDFMQEEKPLLPEAGEGWEIPAEDEKVPEEYGEAPQDDEAPRDDENKVLCRLRIRSSSKRRPPFQGSALKRGFCRRFGVLRASWRRKAAAEEHILRLTAVMAKKNTID